GLTVSNQASLRGAFAARFRADGSLAWAAPATNTGARITAFCTDNAGGYWLTGPVPTPFPFGPQPAMAHYNAQGQLLTAVIAEGAYPPVSSSILSIPGEISLMAPLPEGGVVAVIPSTVWQDVSSGLPWEPRNYQLAGYQYRSVATFNPRGFQEVITWTEKIYSDYRDQFTALAVDSLSRIHFSGQFASKAWVELSSYQGLDPLSSDSARLATYFASYDTDGALLGVRQASTSDLAVHDTNRVSVITAACLAVDSENNLVAAGSYTGQAELDGFSLPAGPSPDSSRAFIAKLGRSPAIVTTPADTTAIPGQRAQFSVTASGPAPLTYQWLHDGAPLPGKTGSTLVIPAIKVGDAGHYSVRVSSPWGSAESAAATLSLGVEGTLIQLVPGVSVTGTIGSIYKIQASSDGIHDWKTVGQVTLSTSPQPWVDENGVAGDARFLKTVPGP
ncbi:MAG TPA: immunoglobulin domain-containing protein, partial [Candidatus Limnocylindria bacterium]|nr:immunoglobulin domain-containing protein [Candidatus Limnocylindria bacterium]